MERANVKKQLVCLYEILTNRESLLFVLLRNNNLCYAAINIRQQSKFCPSKAQQE